MSKKQKMTAVVISQEKIAEDIYSMWLKAEPVAAEAVPGQFISMYTNDGAKLLPRPISLCEIDKEKGALRVVYRVTGEKTGTKQFSQMKAGDSLEVMGPLGNGFDLETGKEKKALLFGGGIGVPPMRSDSDAACDQAVCTGERNRVLHFHGRENGVRNRSLSWMCLPVEGSG